MRRNIFGILGILGFSMAGNAYNFTDVMQYNALGIGHALVYWIPEPYFEEKFSMQFGLAIHDPAMALVVLGAQGYLKDSAASISAGATTLNRVIAKQLAKHYQVPESQGYFLAAGVDLAMIPFLPTQGPLGIFRASLVDFKVIGALANGVEQFYIENGKPSEIAGLSTALRAGLLGMTLAGVGINHKVSRALIIESGIRLLPNVLELTSAHPILKEVVVISAGIPMIQLARSMAPGLKQNFVMATGMAFLIGLTHRLMGLAMSN